MPLPTASPFACPYGAQVHYGRLVALQGVSAPCTAAKGGSTAACGVSAEMA